MVVTKECWKKVLDAVKAIQKCERKPVAYFDKQAGDDLFLLIERERRTELKPALTRFQRTMRAQHEELQALRQLYCTVIAAAGEEDPNCSPTTEMKTGT